MNTYTSLLDDIASRSRMRPGDRIDPSDGLLRCGICGEPREAIIDTLSRGRIKVPVVCRCDALPDDGGVDPQRGRALREKGLRERPLRQCTFENDSGCNPEASKRAQAYVDHWPEMRQRGAGLILWGDIGTGKSYLAACIANALIDQGVSACMTNFARILNSLTGLFSEDRNNYLDDLNRNSLLILDDFGMERGSEFALEQLFSVIDLRTRSKKPLIITTNLTLREMQNPSDMAHARIYDRVLERCVPVKVNRQNQRKLAGEAVRGEVRALLGMGNG